MLGAPAEPTHWRLLIVSPLVDAHGPLEAYRWVQRVLLADPQPSLSLTDISVVGPGDSNFTELRQWLGRTRGWSPSMLRGDVVFEDAYVYRLTA